MNAVQNRHVFGESELSLLKPPRYNADSSTPVREYGPVSCCGRFPQRNPVEGRTGELKPEILCLAVSQRGGCGRTRYNNSYDSKIIHQTPQLAVVWISRPLRLQIAVIVDHNSQTDSGKER